MINILPLEQLKHSKINPEGFFENNVISDNDLTTDYLGNYSLFNSGREAIRYLFKNLNLSRFDETYITTTTDSSFVSTCVSANIFNFTKISRVLTDKTKIIFIIHSFGFPHPKLLELRKLADKKGLILIEDCAFAFDSYFNKDIRLGSVGDYSIYSLSKIFPISYGGILSCKKKVIRNNHDSELDLFLKKWLKKLLFLKMRRIDNYFYVSSLFSNKKHIYSISNGVNPFMFGYLDETYEQVMKTNKKIKFGLSHVRNEIHIPLNPFIEKSDYDICLKGMI